jgi:hypothetical protein
MLYSQFFSNEYKQA